MMKSMTGFGRSSVSSKLGKLTLEITSVNKRFLEINIFLPRTLTFFEHEIRKWIGNKIFRGQISLRFEYSPSDTNIDAFLPDPGISPLQLAKLEGKTRQRASRNISSQK